MLLQLNYCGFRTFERALMELLVTTLGGAIRYLTYCTLKGKNPLTISKGFKLHQVRSHDLLICTWCEKCEGVVELRFPAVLSLSNETACMSTVRNSSFLWVD